MLLETVLEPFVEILFSFAQANLSSDLQELAQNTLLLMDFTVATEDIVYHPNDLCWDKIVMLKSIKAHPSIFLDLSDDIKLLHHAPNSTNIMINQFVPTKVRILGIQMLHRLLLYDARLVNMQQILYLPSPKSSYS